MIEFADGSLNARSSFKHAQVGDKFCVIEYGQWSNVPCSVLNYEVKNVGKRDIKCETSNGAELIVKVENTYKNPNAYTIGGVEAKKAIEVMRTRNRQNECLKMIEGKYKTFDNDLMCAIEIWHEKNQNA